MCSAVIMASAANKMEGWDHWQALPDTSPTWEGQYSPRLQASDLTNPEVYHRRLETYIMNLK